MIRPSMGHSVALALGATVVGSGLARVSPLQNAITAAPATVAIQTQPVAYLVGAPLFGVWDSLSLLTLSQHYAVLVTLVVLHLAWRARVTRRTWSVGGRASVLRRIGREAALGGLSLVGLLGFYAAGMVLPRPMTGVELVDPDLLTIDFHSHTKHSHDGWKLFDAPRNRAWHEAGGFDVAYITDHYTWRGVDDASADNPRKAGERTVLLSGAEIRIHRRPTNILGDRSRYLFALDADSVYMDPDSIAAGYARLGLAPTLLYTMPGGLRFVLPFSDELPSGVIGIELSDGSPRGLEQVRAERAEILALADSMNLALLGAANLHGWGRTAASWSVMRIPGWRDMAPEEVGAAIERELHAQRRDAVQVVERRMPYHRGSSTGLALTLPWLTLEHFRMLSGAERISWLAWIAAWAVVLQMLGAGSRVSVPRVGEVARRGTSAPSPLPHFAEGSTRYRRE